MTLKIYPDHANWIGLARGSEDQTAFEILIQAGYKAVLSFPQVLELANTPEAAAAGTAKYMDRIAQLGGTIWIRGLRQLRIAEALSEFERWLTGTHIVVEPFVPTFSDALAGQVSWPNIGETRAYSVERISKQLRQNKALPDHKKLRAAYPNAQAAVGALRRGRRQVRFSEVEKRRWIASEVPDRVTLRSGLEVNVGHELRTDFAAAVDMSTCPAFRATFAAYGGRNLAGAVGKPSDVEDLLHVVGPAYCDVAFVDKQSYHVLATGGFSPLPKRNGEFSAWLQAEQQQL
jgi:hypothetical protein